MRLMRFNPEAEYVPGKPMVVADTLCRSALLSEQEPLKGLQGQPHIPNWKESEKQAGIMPSSRK